MTVASALAYDGEGKEFVRDTIVRLAAEVGAKSILDLWGGGRSMRQFREACPNAKITAVERRRFLMPRAAADASAHSVAFFAGDVMAVPRPESFDYVWLDFCSQWSGPVREAVKRFAGADYLAVTVMSDRDGLGKLTHGERAVSIASRIAAHTRMRPLWCHRYYRNKRNQEMLVFIFRRGGSGAPFRPDAMMVGIDKRFTYATKRAPVWMRVSSSSVSSDLAARGDSTCRVCHKRMQGASLRKFHCSRRCAQDAALAKHYGGAIPMHRSCKTCGADIPYIRLQRRQYQYCQSCMTGRSLTAHRRACAKYDAKMRALRPPKVCSVCGLGGLPSNHYKVHPACKDQWRRVIYNREGCADCGAPTLVNQEHEGPPRLLCDGCLERRRRIAREVAA